MPRPPAAPASSASSPSAAPASSASSPSAAPPPAAWTAFARALVAPVDAASLAAFRVLFGALMILDAVSERPLLSARISEPDHCVFSCFGLQPLSHQGSHLLLAVLMAAAILITLGLFYRVATPVFGVVYWYSFFLDKRRWNNHSYLFGTLATLAVFMDLHTACSLDALLWRHCCCRGGCGRGSGTSSRGGVGAARERVQRSSSSSSSPPLPAPPPHVPAWQLWLLRVLHMMVYFIAGLKKLMDADWTGGQAMTRLHNKPMFQALLKPYVFVPLLNAWRWSVGEGVVDGALLSTPEDDAAGLHRAISQADDKLFEVSVGHFIHQSGLLLDLAVGWLLLHPRTRTLGIFLAVSFHVMTTQLFSIGMFPYVSLVLVTLWLPPTWPKALARCGSQSMTRLKAAVWPPNALPTEDAESSATTQTLAARPVVHAVGADAEVAGCAYPSTPAAERFPGLPAVLAMQQTASSSSASSSSSSASADNPPQLRCRHHATALAVALLLLFEWFLPYSHFISRGYNSWTQGLYGYSWDMMIHTWTTQHIRIRIVPTDRDEFFIRPGSFVGGNRHLRHFKHPDMLKQYAACVRQNLQRLGVEDMGVHVDVWRSMNGRFQQRFLDPRVDLVRAPWSPWEDTPWLMPLMFELDGERERLDMLADKYSDEEAKAVVFVADFPGMELEHYVNGSETASAMLVLMNGTVQLEFTLEEDIEPGVPLSEQSSVFYTPRVGENVSLPVNMTHIVHTTGSGPATYMYAYEAVYDEEEDDEVDSVQKIPATEGPVAVAAAAVTAVDARATVTGTPRAVSAPASSRAAADDYLEEFQQLVKTWNATLVNQKLFAEWKQKYLERQWQRVNPWGQLRGFLLEAVPAMLFDASATIRLSLFELMYRNATIRRMTPGEFDAFYQNAHSYGAPQTWWDLLFVDYSNTPPQYEL